MEQTTVLRLQKWAIWIALITIVVLLRHLFPIFFLTFVLSYIGNTGVNALTRRFPHRKVNVVLVFVGFLAVISGVLLLVVPRMLNEARNLARQYITTEAARPDGGETFLHREAREAVDTVIVRIAGTRDAAEFRQSEAYATIVARIDGALEGTGRNVAAGVTTFANTALFFVLNFIVAMILSFILVWDLPRTRERLTKFSQGRTADIYREISPSITAFGVVLGRAFEAQSIVAVVNAVLSLIVFVLLGLPSVALLAMIVFVCSYIPLLGMIISTLPAAFLALKVGGISHVLWLIVAIVVIHAIEAYMLNPLIYGRHLKLHPLAVLVILLVAEHLLGVWGLLLGVPVAAFILKYVIEGEA